MPRWRRVLRVGVVLLLGGWAVAWAVVQKRKTPPIRHPTDPFYLQKLGLLPNATGRSGKVAAALGRNAVPFYVYEGSIFEEFRCFEDMSFMHNAERYWLSAIEKHPWRVRKPEDATIFVVPICPSCVASGRCRISSKDHLKRVYRYLKDKKYFKRYGGYDHLTVSTDYRVSQPSAWEGGEMLWNFTHAHYGYFPDAPYRCTVPTAYTVNPHVHTMLRKRLREHQATSSWKPRAEVPGADPPEGVYESTKKDVEPLPRAVPWTDRHYNLFFMGTVRRLSKARSVAMRYLPRKFSPSVLISVESDAYRPCDFDAPNGLEGCSVGGHDASTFVDLISNTKYNLQLEGDDFGSSRFSDAIAAGTPSIVVSDKSWTRAMPNSCQVPWRKIAVQVRPSDFMIWPVGSIKEALVASEGREEWRFMRLFRRAPELPTSPLDMVELINRHAPDVLWEAPNSRAASNLLTNVARRCVPPELLEAHGYAADHFQCEFPDLYDPTVFDDLSHD